MSDPWIQLELKKIRNITRIEIYYRLDCCEEKLPNVEIKIGDNELTLDNAATMKDNDLCGTYEEAENKVETLEPKDKMQQIIPSKKDDEDPKKETGSKLEEKKPKKIERHTGRVAVVDCSTVLTAKYITIQVTDKKIKNVNIAEVKIYGPMRGKNNIDYINYKHSF